MIINIQDDILVLNSKKLLQLLLKDKTTKKNIMWATDLYQESGKAYERNEEITLSAITGNHINMIKTRARKEFEQQNERTRIHAEVFTPSWIVNKMNNYADESWFGRPDVFNVDGEPTEKIIFDEKQSWQKYVDSKILEITCGEAPYLVSRYDVATGEVIPIEKRIGMLDRKLRVINENAETEEEWMKWTIRAFQATYGYEFQGDNLLIARVNVLMTFEEYLKERWNREPSDKEYKKMINIIAWNLWQMDGLSGTIPYCEAEEKFHQMDLFELMGMQAEEEKKMSQPRCRIYDWRANKSIEFKEGR